MVDRNDYRKQGDRKISLYTSDLSNLFDALTLLYHLFTYNEPSKFRDWGSAIEYARVHANRDMIASGDNRPLIKEFRGQAG